MLLIYPSIGYFTCYLHSNIYHRQIITVLLKIYVCVRTRTPPVHQGIAHTICPFYQSWSCEQPHPLCKEIRLLGGHCVSQLWHPGMPTPITLAQPGFSCHAKRMDKLPRIIMEVEHGPLDDHVPLKVGGFPLAS